MTSVARFAAALAVVLGLGSCGGGYEIPSARLNLVSLTESSTHEAYELVAAFLVREGFEDLGRYDAMIRLVQQNPPSEAKDRALTRLNRERSFLNRARNLRVEFSDFADEDHSQLVLSYTPPAGDFVEIEISEQRPGGFSEEGHQFYKKFLFVLQEKHGSAVVVVNEPPQTDDAEYRRVKTEGLITTVVWSAIAFGISFLFTGWLSLAALKKRNLRTFTKRLIFTLLNTLLATPVPLPATIIFVPGPNLLAFPWITYPYYDIPEWNAPVAFACALIVCSVVSVSFFKDEVNGDAATT